MGSHQIQKADKNRNTENIFLDQYAWLFDWALRMSRGSREEAEDLVQDLYVRFAQSPTTVDTTDVDRLRGYLYKALRNLSISKARSSGRDVLSTLHAVDFDSIESALSGVDRSRLLHVRSDLAGICQYACIRRKTSRAGSVLILRFFLGYYPSEIVRLLKTTRGAVAKLTENARLEAKAFLTRPGSLRFLGQDSSPVTPSAQYLPDDPTALFAELHRRIFAETEGTCAEPGDLEKRYADHPAQKLTTQELAHLVSCSACLERANLLLRLPSLTERFPDDLNRPRDGNPPSSASGAQGGILPRLRKKLRDTYEHRPRKLQLAVNGEIRGAQQVTSAHSDFQIKLKALSRPKFVEIISEQGLRLLYLDLEEEGVTDLTAQRAETVLSDERSLAIEVSLSGGTPVVHVSYYDPVLEEPDEAWDSDQELQPPAQAVPPATPVRTRFGERLRKRLTHWLSAKDWRWPASVAAACAVAAIALVSFAILNQSKKPSPGLPAAATLLAQSERVAELVIPPHGAARQTFSLEVRSDQGKLLEARKVETLRSRMPRRSVIRLLDSKRKLLAGRWSDSGGEVITYSERSGLQHSPADTSPQLAFDSAWAHVPEAADFDRISGETGRLSVRRERDGYDLAYVNQAGSPAATLISADLVLAGDSIHPVSETLRIREGRETREYRFQELSYEILPPSRVEDGDFDVDPDLVNLHSSVSIVPTGPINTAHLALEALELLNNLGPDVEQIVDVDRNPDGSVELSGVFTTSEEKERVVHVFQPLRTTGSLKLSLHSGDEPADRNVPSGLIKIKIEELAPIATDSRLIPFDPELRSALSKQGLSNQEIDTRIRQLSVEAHLHGSQLHREAWNIHQIAEGDFSLDELQRMPPEDKILWLTLLDKHLRSFDRELAALYADLTPVFSGGKTPPKAPPTHLSSLQTVNEFGLSTVALNAMSDRLHLLLTAGLTLSSSSNSQNHNVAEIFELLADLKSQESQLRRTVGRLQMIGQDSYTR